MNPSRRNVVLLGLLILLLLLGSGYVLLREMAPGGDATDVADGGSPSPSEVASDATDGSVDGGAEGSPSPSPSEVGEDAAVGGADGGGEDGDADDGDGASGDGDGDGPSGDGGGDNDNATSGDGEDDDPAISGTDGDGDGTDAGGTDGDSDSDRDLAGELEADTRDATRADGLPETGAGAVLPGLLLLAAGVALRPRR